MTSDAYFRALDLATEVEELATYGRLTGEKLESMRVQALDCILDMARSDFVLAYERSVADEASS